MQLAVDQSTNTLVRGAGQPGDIGTASNPLVLSRADTPIELLFLPSTYVDAAPAQLPVGTVISWGMKIVGHFEDVFIVECGSFTAGATDTDPYTATMHGNTTRAQDLLNTPDGDLTNDIGDVDLAGDITWLLPGATEPCRLRVYASLQNIYTQGDEDHVSQFAPLATVPTGVSASVNDGVMLIPAWRALVIPQPFTVETGCTLQLGAGAVLQLI